MTYRGHLFPKCCVAPPIGAYLSERNRASARLAATPSALDKGCQISAFMGSSIDYFVACKVEQLPFEDNFFDYVIGSAVLHHTCPEKSVKQIFRVLKGNGRYIGFGELATPRIMGYLWGRFGMAGRREKDLGVNEGEYSFGQWKA